MLDRKLIKVICDQWRRKPDFIKDLEEVDKIMYMLCEKWLLKFTTQFASFLNIFLRC